MSAKTNLDRALEQLERLPSMDPGAVAFSAHALNNYVTVANATIDLLAIHLGDHPDGQVRIGLEALRHATNMMSSTITQLITASVGSGPRLIFEKVDFALGIQRGCQYYQRIAEKRHLEIKFESSAKNRFVHTDRVATGAVLDNLLSNAVKYSPPGKKIYVSVEEDPDYLICRVEDEGPGIKKEDLARLFERPSRRSSPKPSDSKGYGLAVAQTLITSLGGKIWCSSIPNKGSAFFFSVPIFKSK
jgi:signal transduction histidine kinase